MPTPDFGIDMHTKLFFILKNIVIFVLLLSLAACSNNTDTTTSKTVGSGPGISMEIQYSSGNAITASGNAKVYFTVRDDKSVAVSNVIIKLSTNLANLSSSSVLTDDKGNASVTLSSAGTSGADTLEASAVVNSFTYTKSIGYQVDLNTNSSQNNLVISLQDGSGNNITNISDTQGGTLKATLLDSNNNPIKNQLVVFSTKNGVLNPSNGQVLTDNNGVATISLLAGTTAGADQVSAEATIGSQTTKATLYYNITLNNTATESSYKLDIAFSNGLATDPPTVSATNSGTITLTLTETTSSTPIAGQVVKLSSFIAVISPASSVVTDSNGKATFTLKAGNELGADYLVAETKIGNTTISNSLGFVVSQPSVKLGSLVSGNFTDKKLVLSSSTITAKNTAQIQVHFVDNNNTLYTEEPVEVSFSSLCQSQDLSYFTPYVNADSATKAKNIPVPTINGTATIFYIPSGCSGEDPIVAKAQYGGTEFTASSVLTVQPVTPHSYNLTLKITDSAGNTVSKIQPGTTAKLLANVTDLQGNPVQGAIVAFEVVGIQKNKLAYLGEDDKSQQITALTDSSGNATGTITALFKSGAASVRAAVFLNNNTEGNEPPPEEVSTYASFLVPAYFISSVSLTDSSSNTITEIRDDLPGTITVKVLDDTGSAQSGVPVIFSTSSATVSNSSIITDSNGEAKTSLLYNGTEGAGQVNIKIANANSATYILGYHVRKSGSSTTTPKISLALSGKLIPTASDPKLISATAPGTLTATLTQSDGSTPIAGEIIYFTLNNDSANISVNSVVTDNSGKATLTLKAGTTLSANTITASATVDGVATTTSQNFNVVAPALDLGKGSAGTFVADTLDISNATINDGASTTITATVVDTSNSNALFSEPLEVAFSSLCVAQGKATITDKFTTINGQAIATYTSNGCSGTDTITATLVHSGISYTGSVDVTVNAATTGTPSLALAFPSGNTVTGTASVSVTATITDASGAAVANAPVTFATQLGKFDPASGTALTNSSGVATITLLSNGTEGADSVTATASVDGTDISDIGGYKVDLSAGTGAPIITLALTDPAGSATTSISATSAGTLTATLTKADGTTAIPGEVISFNIDNDSASTSITSAVTDTSGKVTLTLKAGNKLSANIITASATVDGEATTSTLNFNVVSPSLALGKGSGGTFTSGSLEISATSISDGSSVTVTASFVDTSNSNALFTEPVDVVFNSICVVQDLASITDKFTTINGKAYATYTSTGCNSSDTITATVTHSGITYTASVDVTITQVVVTKPNISLTLEDNSGNAITGIRADLPGVIKVKVTDDNANGLGSIIVSFSSTFSTFNPSSGSILTDSNGDASIKIIAGNTITADTIIASVVSNGVTTTSTLNYTIDPPKILLGKMVSGTFTNESLALGVSGSLSAGGTTTVTASLVVDDGDGDNTNDVLVSDSYTVNFTSNCVSQSLATLDASVTSINGSATATYRAKGCSGADIITATANIGGQVFTASVQLTVADDSAGSIQFISATPSNIALKGTGGSGRQETSDIIFKVIGATGLPLANQAVDFVTDTSVGGISLLASSANTNSDGEVTAILQSGNVSTPVRVTATVQGSSPSISTQSDQLTITTGLADQNSISLSTDILAPEGHIDGTEVNLTIRAADAFNHSVPDGTSVVVVAEGGAIKDVNNTCLTQNGACTVTWVAQNPIPDDNRITVMAYIIGNESFYDRNGDGVFNDANNDGVFDNPSQDDIFDDLPEAYLDTDESSAFSGSGSTFVNGAVNTSIASGYNPTLYSSYTNDFSRSEYFLDFNKDGAFSSADTQYNGVACSQNCSSTKLIHVRDSIVLVAASSNPVITITDPNSNINTAYSFPTGGDPQTFSVQIADTKALCLNAGQTARTDAVTVDTNTTNTCSDGSVSIRQSAPTGSSINVTASVGTLSGSTPGKVPNQLGPLSFSITIAPSDSNTVDEYGTLDIELTTPSGNIVTKSIALTDPAN